MSENELLLKIYHTARSPDNSLDMSVVLRVLELYEVTDTLGYLTTIKSLHAHMVQLAKDRQ